MIHNEELSETGYSTTVVEVRRLQQHEIQHLFCYERLPRVFPSIILQLPLLFRTLVMTSKRVRLNEDTMEA